MAEPDIIYEEILTIPTSALTKDNVLAAFDKGCSLTKVIIGKQYGEITKLRCITFHNDKWETALKWLAANSNLKKDDIIRLTGVGGDVLRHEVAKALGCKSFFVDEFAAQIRGIEFLLENGQDEEIYFRDPELHYKNDIDDVGDTWKTVSTGLGNESNESMNSLYPTIFAFLGSAFGNCLITKDGDSRFVQSILVCGKSFMGLASLLLGTTDFQEVDRLALKGDRSKVDSLASDAFGNTNSKLYLAFPRDMSLFPLGLMTDPQAKAQASREDIAAGLITLFAQQVLPTIMGNAAMFKAKRVVIGGNLVRSRFFREALMSCHMVYQRLTFEVPVKFLKIGHTAALGALLSDVE